MPELSLNHIDQIARDISKQEIAFSHLLEDLIDHICCDVEYEMQQGLSFSDAYRRVKQKMGPRRINEIQEETLYLVDTKYRYMKNTMKITGVAGTILLGIAAMFKIQHWPGAGIMMTLGALILAFVFLPSALGVLWKETHSAKKLFLFISAFLTGMLFIFGILFKIQHWQGAGIVISLATLSGLFLFIPSLVMTKLRESENGSKKWIYISGAFGSACYALGLLFKIQHWPLAQLFVVIGLLTLFLISFPWYTWVTWKDEKNVTARFIFILTGSLAVIVPAALVNLSLQRNYDIGFFIHIRQQQAVYNCKFFENQSILKTLKDTLTISVANQIHAKTIDLIQIIDEAGTKMVAESEGKPGLPLINPQQFRQTERGTEIEYDLLSKPFSPDPVKDFLLPGCAYRQKIDAAITSYLNYLSGLPSGKEIKSYQGLISTSVCLPGDKLENNEISLMTGLHSLMLLKNCLLTVEFHALNSIGRQ